MSTHEKLHRCIVKVFVAQTWTASALLTLKTSSGMHVKHDGWTEMSFPLHSHAWSARTAHDAKRQAVKISVTHTFLTAARLMLI
jgi:hypothetical protein